jgi:hypothetical protein
MAVSAVNLTIEQGADFETIFDVSNPDSSVVSLVGYSAAAKIRKFPSSTSYSSFSISIVAATGKITVSMANTITSTLTPGRYYYDLVIIKNSDGKRTRVVEGMALVTAGIT